MKAVSILILVILALIVVLIGVLVIPVVVERVSETRAEIGVKTTVEQTIPTESLQTKQTEATKSETNSNIVGVEKIELNPSEFKDFTGMPFTVNGLKLIQRFNSTQIDKLYFHNLFNGLYFASRQIGYSECVAKKKTHECLFYHIILNNKEELCTHFPEKRVVSNTIGGNNVTVLYRKSCIDYARMYKKFFDADDKWKFCRDKDMQEPPHGLCIQFSCLSLAVKDRPSECGNYDYFKNN